MTNSEVHETIILRSNTANQLDDQTLNGKEIHNYNHNIKLSMIYDSVCSHFIKIFV